MTNKHTFGSVLGWDWASDKVSWLGKMSAMFERLRRSSGYYTPASMENVKAINAAVRTASEKLGKSATRQMIVDAYDNILRAMADEITRLDAEVRHKDGRLETAQSNERFEASQLIIAYEQRDEALRHQARLSRQLEALLNLIAPEPEDLDLELVRYDA